MDDRDRARLEDIVAHATEAQRYLDGVTPKAFRDDRRLRLVTERLLEIIGEAASGLSEETRNAIDYDWRAVRGLRNILAHQYGAVDPDQIHRVVANRLPDLVARVEVGLGKTGAAGKATKFRLPPETRTGRTRSSEELDAELYDDEERS